MDEHVKTRMVQVTKPGSNALLYWERWLADRGVETERRLTDKGDILFRQMNVQEIIEFQSL